MSEHVSYLEAKREIDDRALDRDVLSAFSDRLPNEPAILEVGSGTATMPERLFEWGVLESGHWIAVDSRPDALAAGRDRITARTDAVAGADGVHLGEITVEFVEADAFEYAAGREEQFDAVVGSAFFDIVDAKRAVGAFGAVTDLVYAPITYDGTTAFDPDDPEDEIVLDRYRQHMCEYRTGSPEGAKTLEAALSEVLADAPSPWLIEPPYADGERTVASHVIETIERAVGETGYDASGWAERRREQLFEGRLAYTATNRDVLGRP